MKRTSSSSHLNIFIITALIVVWTVPSVYAQTKWTKHPNNPVLHVGATGSWDDADVITGSVLFDGTTYHMWYGGYGGSVNRVGYATSLDGVNWIKADTANPVLDVGSAGSWDDAGVSCGPVLFDGTSYHMWYLGYDGTTDWRTGYATSDDGVNWTKVDTANPVLDVGSAGSWDDDRAAGWSVLLKDTTYQMWYTGGDGSTYRIGYATSVDGVNWTKVDTVLDVGSTGSWDDRFVLTPAVVFDDTVYHMWYTGYDGLTDRIGYATSVDGVNWTKVDTVLDVGSSGEWDDSAVWAPAVILDDTTFHMWYIGYDGTTQRIGYATTFLDTTVAIGANQELMPTSFLLHQNYPNPFNPISMIGYELPQTVEVTLVVYDILGQEVARLVDGVMEPGYHQVQWNAREVPSGIYIARLVTPEYAKSIKMVLLK